MKSLIEFIQEEFRPININNLFIIDNYLISNYGNVYSKYSNRLLRPSIDKDGYLYCGLYINNHSYNFRIGRLVLMTFKPIENPENFQANHLDGNKFDNSIWNLEWVTQIENIHHAIKTGLANQLGENHHATKLTNDDVHIICKYLEDGYTYDEICKYMNIPLNSYRKFKDIIHNIVRGVTWTHISKDYNIIKTRQYCNPRYSEDVIHNICKYLEIGKSYNEICNIMDIHDYKFKKFMYDIACKEVYRSISDNYNIITPKSEKDPLFTDKQLHHICNMLKDNINSPEILKSMNIDINSLDSNTKHCIINCISNIKRKKTFTHISNNYF